MPDIHRHTGTFANPGTVLAVDDPARGHLLTRTAGQRYLCLNALQAHLPLLARPEQLATALSPPMAPAQMRGAWGHRDYCRGMVEMTQTRARAASRGLSVVLKAFSVVRMPRSCCLGDRRSFGSVSHVVAGVFPRKYVSPPTPLFFLPLFQFCLVFRFLNNLLLHALRTTSWNLRFPTATSRQRDLAINLVRNRNIMTTNTHALWLQTSQLETHHRGPQASL